MNAKSYLMVGLLVLSAIFISGCVQKEVKQIAEESKKQGIPEVTPKTTETIPRKAMSLEKIEPVKEREKIPEQFFPAKYPWKLLKGDEKSGMFYPSFVPRKPERVFKTDKEVYLSGVVDTSIPLVEDGVYVASKYRAYKLDFNGNVIWERSFEELDRFVESYGLGKYFYIGTSSTGGGEGKPLILALNRDSGSEEWSVEIGEKGDKVTSNIVVVDGVICAGTVDSYVSCFSENGEPLWSKQLEGIIRGLAYGHGTLFVTTEVSTKLYAFDLKTGKSKWIYDHGDMISTPTYAGGKLFFTDSSGNVVAISENGNFLWKKFVGAGGDVNSNPLLAVSENRIYVARTIGEGPLQLYSMDFDGNIVGNFTLITDEYPGIPLATHDMVILPVKKDYGYAKIYLLWKGTQKLYELKVLENDEIWMPKVSVGYGNIYIAVRVPDMIYMLSDKDKPSIKGIKAELSNGSLVVKTTVKDERSAIYRVLLVYSINGSEWKYQDMELSRRYIMEPIGGYGLNDEDYEAKIPVTANSTVEFYVVAIDNVGNYEFSEVYGYRVVMR